MCTAKIESCGKNKLRWLRVGMWPLKPHARVAPDGTKPTGAWSAEPPGRRAQPGADATDDSDEEAVPVNGLAAEQNREVVDSIDTLSDPFASARDDASRGDEHWNLGAPLWSRPGDRLAWAASVRVF